jgi:hypothetical protein
VQYVATSHIITVTNYHFTWCTVVINVIFNTCFRIVICYICKFYFKDFLHCNFELFSKKCMKIDITGHIFLLTTNYQGFQNNYVQWNSFKTTLLKTFSHIRHQNYFVPESPHTIIIGFDLLICFLFKRTSGLRRKKRILLTCFLHQNVIIYAVHLAISNSLNSWYGSTIIINFTS